MSNQVTSVLEVCRRCNVDDVGLRQYAAIDSMCDSLQPPVIVNSTPMGVGEHISLRCVHYRWSALATQACILARFRYLQPVVVNFIGYSSHYKSQLASWSECLSNVGHITASIIVQQTGNAGGEEYSLSLSNGGELVQLDQGEMLSFVVDMCQGRESIMWYWDAPEEFHQAYISQHIKCVWVGNAPGRYPSASSFLVPYMFSCPSIDNCFYVSLDRSYTIAVRDSDADHRLNLMLNTVCSEVLTATTSTGRCYNCQLVLNVFPSICKDSSKLQKHTLKLSPSFITQDGS